MTQEEKLLLLKDLCARLLYGVMFYCKYYNVPTKLIFISTDYLGLNYVVNGKFYLHEIKPYLRPMSSMTEEEKNEHFGRTMTIDIVQTSKEVIDWLNSHHFDYRGLIEKGLALEALKEMYNIKEK